MKIVQGTASRIYHLAQLSTREMLEEWKYLRGIAIDAHGCKPTYINIEIINRCCLRCKMCYIWQNKAAGELTTSDWIKVINRLKEWLGTFRLTITGGEPFMKKGIWEFLVYCGDLGIPVVVVTSGYYFIKRHLQQLLNLNITQLVISIDSLHPDKHDCIRGFQGVFDRAWNVITYLSDKPRRFLIATNTVIMADNIEEIPDFPSTLQQAGVERIFFQPIQGGFGKDNRSIFQSDLWPNNLVAINKVFQELVIAKRQGAPIANTYEELNGFRTYLTQGANWERPFECSAGRKMFHCDAYGNVRMCVPYAGNIGNLMDEKPQAIWSGTRAHAERTKILNCREACMLNCNRDYSLDEKISYAVKYLRNVMQ